MCYGNTEVRHKCIHDADGQRNDVSHPINHIALHTELDAECDHQETSVGRYRKHSGTQTNSCWL